MSHLLAPLYSDEFYFTVLVNLYDSFTWFIKGSTYDDEFCLNSSRYIIQNFEHSFIIEQELSYVQNFVYLTSCRGEACLNILGFVETNFKSGNVFHVLRISNTLKFLYLFYYSKKQPFLKEYLNKTSKYSLILCSTNLFITVISYFVAVQWTIE
ncbi:hypothetical protein MXB_1242, partial [Myxobolus squamalis]